MFKAVHRKSFTQLSAKFHSKDPSIVRMLYRPFTVKVSHSKVQSFAAKTPALLGCYRPFTVKVSHS